MRSYPTLTHSSLPLVLFRIGFGLLMLVSTIRFAARGWIQTLYIDPIFHFTYYGFHWVRPIPEPWIFVAFGLIGLAALGIALGFFYRISILSFFLLFTYIELIDKAYYLNHYYLVSILSFMMIWLPLNRWCSLDVWLKSLPQRGPLGDRATQTTSQPPLSVHSDRHERLKSKKPHEWLAPRWMIDVLRFQFAIVYIFAGVAKLQPDWILRAMPMKIWLAARADLPLLGPWLATEWAPYLMSWGGTIYDLTIAFFLLYRPTRRYAFVAVVGFHLLTGILFPQIGMFPYIMIVGAIVFCSGSDITRLTSSTKRIWKRYLPVLSDRDASPANAFGHESNKADQRVSTIRRESSFALYLLTLVLLFQMVIPLRHWLYPGDVLWTEEGFRYAWKVMLVEKTGRTTYSVTDPSTGQSWPIYSDAYLTDIQEMQMAYQPDMILEFAHFLQEEMARLGRPAVEVRAESFVSYNGRPSRLLIDPTIDLAKEPRTLWPKPWILP